MDKASNSRGQVLGAVGKGGQGSLWPGWEPPCPGFSLPLGALLPTALNQGSHYPALSRLSGPSQLLLTPQPRA